MLFHRYPAPSISVKRRALSLLVAAALLGLSLIGGGGAVTAAWADEASEEDIAAE